MDVETNSTTAGASDRNGGAATNFVADTAPVNGLGERRFVDRLGWFAPLNLCMALGSTIPTAAVATMFGLLYSAHLTETQANAAIGITNVVGAFVGAVAAIIAGTLSDRTRTRWGRRNPWIVGGGIIVVIALFLMSVAPVTRVWPVVLAFCLFQFGLNACGAAYSALLPDRVATGLMGRASAYTGFGTLAGIAIGGVAASMLIKVFGVEDASNAYRILPWALVVVTVVVALPGADLRTQERVAIVPQRSVLTVITDFRLPRSRDYWLAYFGRFLTAVGVMLTMQTSTQILRYYLDLSVEESADLHALSSLVLVVFGATAALVAGSVSDRIGRRKPLVIGSALVGGLGPLLYFVVPLSPVVLSLVYTAIGGSAFGVFQATDQALMVEVLPDPETAARDLGFLGTTNTLSGVLAGALGAVLIGTAGFPALFLTALAAGVAGAVIFSRLRTVS